MAGLSGRLARLEARVQDLGLARMARRQAGDGVSAVEIEAEMRRFFRLVRTQLAANYGPRDLAELISREYGTPVAKAFHQVKEARAARMKRRTG